EHAMEVVVHRRAALSSRPKQVRKPTPAWDYEGVRVRTSIRSQGCQGDRGWTGKLGPPGVGPVQWRRFFPGDTTRGLALPRGDAMVKWWSVIIVLSGAVWLAVESPGAAADEGFLRNGGRRQGDVDEGALTLQTPQGAYKVSRERVWRITLGLGPSGGSVLLRNGNRLSGRLDAPGYALKVGSETRTFGRAEV